MENWISSHPWMTFVLGVLSIVTVNSMFVSLGGGYKKFPPPVKCKCERDKKMNEEDVVLN